MTDEPGFGKETHSTYEPLPEEIAARRVADPAAHTPDVDTLVETVERGFLHGDFGAARAALSDLAATAREAEKRAGDSHEVMVRVWADRDRLREELTEAERQYASLHDRLMNSRGRVAELEAALRMAEGSTLKAAQLLPMTLSTSVERDHRDDHPSWAGWLLRHKVLPAIRAALVGDGGGA